MKRVIYTCLVGQYDTLKQPLAIDNRFDYICFSNDIYETSIGVWQIKKIPCEIHDNRRLSRYVKMLPHLVLGDYDYSLYIDANIQILDIRFYTIINEKINENELICQVPHSLRDCIYDEIRAAYFGNNVKLMVAWRQMRHLLDEKYPKHYGLFENNVILRKHNDERMIKLAEEWWADYCKYSPRDQFSSMYICWKNNIYPTLLLREGENAKNSELLGYNKHVDGKSPGEMMDKRLRYIARKIRTFIKNSNIKLFLSMDI